MSKNKTYTVLNTVNTGLSNTADFIIHAAGCSDCDKGAAKTCTRETITATSVSAVVSHLRDDLIAGGFEPHEACAFTIVDMPCTA